MHRSQTALCLASEVCRAACRAARSAVRKGVTGAHLNVLFSVPAKPPQRFLKCLVQVGIAAACREPVLLVGATGCKTTVVQAWAQITGRSDISTVHLTPDTQPQDLVGQISPFAWMKALKQVLEWSDLMLQRIEVLVRDGVAPPQSCDRSLALLKERLDVASTALYK